MAKPRATKTARKPAGKSARPRAKEKAPPRKATPKAKAKAKAKATRHPAAKPVSRTTKKRSGFGVKAAGNAGATTSDPLPWRNDLRDALEGYPDDFAGYLRERGSKATDAWVHADAPELAGLEAWGIELAQRHLPLGHAALVAAAQYGFPIAMQRAGSELDNMGYHAHEPSADGAPVETQIQRAVDWLDDPDTRTAMAAVRAFDPSRQLHVWDDDLRPAGDDKAFYWFYEVGQCCLAVVSASGKDPRGESYYEWSPALSVGRGLVIVARGLRENNDSAAVVTALRAAMVA